MWLCPLYKKLNDCFLLLLALLSFETKSVKIHHLKLFTLDMESNKFSRGHCLQRICSLSEVTHVKYCINLCEKVKRKAKVIP